MKLFYKIKRIIRRLFVDYGEIERLIEDKSVKHLNEAKQFLNNSLNENIEYVKEDIKSVKEDIEYVKGNISELKSDISIVNKNTEQFKYFNTELGSIVLEKNKKNILIVGFYGAPNLGDELMLETLLDFFNKMTSVRVTILLADNPEYDIEKYKDIYFLHYPKTMYDFNILASSYDYIIFGGGAIIDDNKYTNKDSYKFDLGTILIKLSMRAITFNKKVICIALSSSSVIENEEYKEKLKYIIKNSYYFSVRDDYTKSLLIKELGLDVADKIERINDIVFSNQLLNSSILEGKSIIEKEINIGIVWISSHDSIQLLRELLERIENICLENNYIKYKVNLIPFYDYNSIDTNFYNNVINEYKFKDKINIEKYPKNMYDTIETLKNNNIIIGMRYHSILLAYALNIPCISICYDIHEHYTNKIKYLNEMFKKDIALKFSNIDWDKFNNIFIKLISENNQNSISLVRNILTDSHNQIIQLLNKIF